ncbi:MAG: response regulator transcription factor [Clostridia bacterium]|nr:response regulator transcription factor [Clostridia bacterium]
MYKVLFADDEKKIRETISEYLSAKGINVTVAENGKDALDYTLCEDFDLIILDVMMPVLDGIGACREIRKRFKTPVLFLSALGTEQDLLKGYTSGADDYITKPFPMSVLYEKCIKMIKRYRGITADNKIALNGIILDKNSVKVYVDEKEVVLSNKDFQLLEYLMTNKNIVLKRNIILSRVWGYDFDGDERVVDTHIKIIRKALGEKAGCLKTVVNSGYCFEVKEQ